MTAPSAATRVRPLLQQAVAAYLGTPQERAINAALVGLDAPLRVALVGMVSSGKSTLLNALIGERLAATDAAECTRVVTWYADGISARAVAHPLVGAAEQLSFRRRAGRTEVDLGRFAPDELRRISVESPNAHLRRLTFIDTPGTVSMSVNTSDRTTELLNTTGTDDSPDVVLYLLRHLHASDVNLLESFRGSGAPDVHPISSVGVLSRADEIGGGRFDALDVAARIGHRYERDRRLRALLQTVVPVAGLLGQTAASLRESDFQAVRRLAGLPLERTWPALLSADRFIESRTLGLQRDEARAALELFGLYGLRMSIALVQQGFAVDASALASRLLEASGIAELRSVLSSRFAERRDILKAQHALRVIELALSERMVPAALELRRRIEEFVATSHDVVELRLLNELSTGDVVVEVLDVERLQRTIGAFGSSPAVRLGRRDDACGQLHDRDELRERARVEIEHWIEVAANPLASATEQRAAGVAVRTCERLAAQLD